MQITGSGGAGDCGGDLVRGLRRGRGGDERSGGDTAGDLYECDYGDGDYGDGDECGDTDGAADSDCAVEGSGEWRVNTFLKIMSVGGGFRRGVAVAAEGEIGDVCVAEDGEKEGVVDADAVGEGALRKWNDGPADDGRYQEA